MFSKGKTIQIFQTTPPPENPSQLHLVQALGSSGIAGTGALPTRSVVSFLWRNQLEGDSKQNLTNGIPCLIVYSLETSHRCTVNSDYITTSPSCPAWPTPTWILISVSPLLILAFTLSPSLTTTDSNYCCLCGHECRPTYWSIMNSLPGATLQHKTDPLPSSHLLMFLI